MREEYCVYYENYEELAQEEPGAEIPLQKDIVWENKNSQSERWKALSVFACSQGLVLELAKQAALWFRSCIPLVDRAFSFYVEAAGSCQ